MNDNRYTAARNTHEAAHGFQMTDEQLTSFRTSLTNVQTVVDRHLTDSFTVTAHCTADTGGQHGVITVAHPQWGHLEFTIPARAELFDDDTAPIPADEATDLGTELSAAVMQHVLGVETTGTAPGS